MAPALLITMDTEGDNVWARPRAVTTRNAASLPRFQALAERFGFHPTWLVNWEMAHEPACVEFLRDVLARDVGEAGLHLHAWDTPPLEPLTDDDARHHPYLTEYREPLMREKIETLARVLEDTMQRPLRSHRAGRWNLDGRYARLLRERGFSVDCSVCPGVSWRSTKGDPRGAGGADYRAAPREPYLVDESDIMRPASAPGPQALLETPMTIGEPRPRWAGRLREVFSKRHFWLRPNGRNGAALRERVDEAVAEGRAHLMFMLHSSELMAGGSPTFRDDAAIERLYGDLEALFDHARARGCAGRTLGEFAAQWRAQTVKAN
ncbi:MAG: deacetylase [Opitutales bacterium]|jgi:hypothetical protein